MPLRRHPALAPLSRDHHAALLLARALQTGASDQLRASLPADLAARAASTCRAYDDSVAEHFDAEEAVLHEAVRGRDPALDAVCAEVEDDHARLRALIDELRSPAPAPTVESLLDRFGRLLEAHVRKEERVLYEGVQRVLGDDALRALGEALEAKALEARRARATLR